MYMDLDCGQNNILPSGYSPTWPIIKWEVGTGEVPDPVLWRENHWGTSCSHNISPGEFNTWNLIPNWAIAEDNLLSCVTETTPANPLCPFEGSTPQDLLKNGITAETLGSYNLAHENYRALLWLWAGKKEANEGTLRLKALGLKKIYGPDSYEQVRDDLFVAADSSAAMNLTSQETLQRCSAWCVEARWGDRNQATAQLNIMLSLAVSQLDRDTIKKALLEIATYPPAGGTSGLGADAWSRSDTRHRRSVLSLLNYESGQAVANPLETLPIPQRFAINQAFPNPFNARLTLEVDVPLEGRMRIRMVNLLGQTVSTILDKNVVAGRHFYSVDAASWASGIYFAVAEHGGVQQVRKLTLLK